MKPQRIEITNKTIIFTILLLLGLKSLWMLRELAISLFIAFMIMSIIKPLVNTLEKKKIPPSVSTVIIFIILFTLFGYGLSWFMPPLLADMSSLYGNLTALMNHIDPNINQYINPRILNQYIPDISSRILPIISGIFSNVIFVVTTIFFSIYFILEKDFFAKFLRVFFKEPDVQKGSRIFRVARERMGAWFWAEVLLMTIVGASTYVGLSLLGVQHALSLGVIAGIFEAFPVIGPVLSAVPAIIFAAAQSYPTPYFLVGATLALYIIIQQLENNFIVPTVMKKATGLNRILTLIVLVVGGKVAGFLGIFIAIPVTLCIDTILKDRSPTP